MYTPADVRSELAEAGFYLSEEELEALWLEMQDDDLDDEMYDVADPTEEELEALFQETLLIELITAEVGQALDSLLAAA